MCEEIGPVAQRLEQGTHNSKKGFCVVFHEFAQRDFHNWPEVNWFARHCAGLRGFAVKISQTVEPNREKVSPLRARARYAFHFGTYDDFCDAAVIRVLFCVRGR
jgi:hypothetical protein